VLPGGLGWKVDEPFPREAARTDRQDDAGTFPSAHDHVRSPGWAVHEVPRLERALLVLDDQHAGPGQNEKVLLGVLTVVVAETLARLEDADVDPELAKGALALEVAVDAERAGVAPPGLAGTDDEPSVDVGDQPEPGFS